MTRRGRAAKSTSVWFAWSDVKVERQWPAALSANAARSTALVWICSAALGDAEHGTDLGEGEALAVIQGDHVRSRSGRLAHLGAHGLAKLALLSVLAPGTPIASSGVGHLAPAGRHQVFEWSDVGDRDRRQPALQLGRRDLERRRQFFVGGRAVQGALELGDRRLRPHGSDGAPTRHPVELTQTVEHGPAHPGDREVSNLAPRSGSKRSSASISPNTPALTRSPVSTLDGNPAARREATNLTTASNGRSAARGRSGPGARESAPRRRPGLSEPSTDSSSCAGMTGGVGGAEAFATDVGVALGGRDVAVAEHSCTERRSAPPSRRCVAKVCRSACGCVGVGDGGRGCGARRGV